MGYFLAFIVQQTVLYVFGTVLLLIQLHYYCLHQIIQHNSVRLGSGYAVVLDYLLYLRTLPFHLQLKYHIQQLLLPRQSLIALLQFNIPWILIHLLTLHNYPYVMFHLLHEVGSEFPHKLGFYQFFEDLLKIHCDCLRLDLPDVRYFIYDSDIDIWEEIAIYKGIDGQFSLQCPLLCYFQAFFCLFVVDYTVSLCKCVVAGEVEQIFSLVHRRRIFGRTSLRFVVLTIKYFSNSLKNHSIICYRLRVPHSVGRPFRYGLSI